MSKNLEEAYKEYTQAQIPDLWDRIEAELPEKKAVSKKKKREMLLRKRVFATSAAAACLCLVVAGSGIYHLIADKSTDEMATIDRNLGITADDIMTEDAVCDVAESVETEATETESVQTEGVKGTLEEMIAESMAEDETIQQNEGAAVEESLQTEAEGKSYDVVVTISDMENTGEEILYYGVVVSATERPVEVDGKVTFCISEDGFGPFEIGKTYSLRLTERERQGMEIQPYLVTEVYDEQ